MVVSHPQLVVLGYSEASMFLRGTAKPKVSSIISIHGAREFGVEAEVARRLDLTFDDVEASAPDDMLAAGDEPEALGRTERAIGGRPR